jgi:beta-phosphoglucomutase
MKIKAVVFDMDGVLIDAKEWHYESLNRALAIFDCEITRLEHVRHYDGLPTRKKLEMLSRDKDFPRHLHARVNHLKQMYLLEIVESQCLPDPQHIEALSRLRDEGFVLGVASNSIRRTVDTMLEKAGLLSYLDFTLSNEDVSKPKPDPEIYLAALDRAGVLPHECVVVEDNQHGVEAATNAGAHVFQVETVKDVAFAGIRSFIWSIEARSRHVQASKLKVAA